ncbi:MAG TPA: anti-sigma factor [Acidimicrobiales bacterium]
MKHEQIEELLGAYALDAVDAEEADTVERHLADCPRCRAEVAAHREVAATLAYTGTSAPEGVWDRIAGALEEPAPAAERVLPAVPGAAPGGRGAVVSMAGSAAAARRGWTRSAATALVGVAAVALVVIGVLSAQLVRQDDRLDRLASAVNEQGLDAAALSAALAPDGRKVALRSDDGRIEVAAVVRPDGEGYVVEDNLPALGHEQTYQLWAMVEGRTVSLGVLGSDPSVTAFRAPADLKALAVTTEAAGGASAPTRAPLVQGFVPTA